VQNDEKQGWEDFGRSRCGKEKREEMIKRERERERERERDLENEDSGKSA